MESRTETAQQQRTWPAFGADGREESLPSTSIDMVLVLSSELVCQIAEKYFNHTMLKKKVKVIDLQPTSHGLVQFSVAFDEAVAPVTMLGQQPGASPRHVLPSPRHANSTVRKGK